MSEVTSEDLELFHFGVKGMKWGVRRTDAQLSKAKKDRSTESRADRKKSSKNLTSYLWESTKDDNIFTDRVTQAEYDTMSTGRQYIEKNQMLSRIAPSKNTALIGETYVSSLPEDSRFYRASIPSVGTQVKTSGGGQKSYRTEFSEIDMKVVKKLAVPSEKERIDAFLEILEKPVVNVPRKKEPITGKQFLESQGYGGIFKTLSTQEVGFRSYNDFIAGQGNQDAPLNKPYFNALRSKGFDAIPDDNDRGRYTKAPLILLDPEGSVKVTSVRKLSTDEINKAQRELVPDKAKR